MIFAIGPSIKGDVIDYDEYLTGERKEGTYFAAANFVFPGLDSTKKKIIGYQSTDGMNRILSQLQNEKDFEHPSPKIKK